MRYLIDTIFTAYLIIGFMTYFTIAQTCDQDGTIECSKAFNASVLWPIYHVKQITDW